ncbi:Uncharacterised protein [Klebsiella michiganensis]|nr:Uncharacterised protein [Klebsiella michiganensis]
MTGPLTQGGWLRGMMQNIAAESGNHIYAAIRLYPDSVIIGDSMQNCALIGDWDSDTPVINNNQHIGYFISGDSSDGYIRPQLVNHGVRNFFIGRYGNGVLDRSTEDNFLIRDCCLTGWFMGPTPFATVSLSPVIALPATPMAGRGRNEMPRSRFRISHPIRRQRFSKWAGSMPSVIRNITFTVSHGCLALPMRRLIRGSIRISINPPTRREPPQAAG